MLQIEITRDHINEAIERILLNGLLFTESEGKCWITLDKAKQLYVGGIITADGWLKEDDDNWGFDDGGVIVGVELTPFGETLRSFARLYQSVKGDYEGIRG